VGHAIAHVGVLKALERAGIPIHCLAGTSGGALVGSLFCAGVTTAQLEKVSRQIGWKRLAGLSLFASKGLATSEPIARFVSRMIAPRTRFSEMAPPLAVTATDLLTGETLIFRDEACPVPEAVRISCTIPVVYAPVVREGRLLVDGGVSDPLPVDAARALGAEFIVAVSLRHRPQELHNLLEVGLQMLDVTTASLAEMAKEHADFAIEVDVGSMDKWDLRQAEKLIALGEEAAQRALPDLERALRRRRSFWFRFLWAPVLKVLGLKPG
jgi:NTE family protein